MIQTYFGYGKGKTTSAIGSAIRCAGCKNKVLFVQLLKNNDSSEFKTLECIESIDVIFCDKHYCLYDNLDKEQTDAFSKAYRKLVFEDVAKIFKNYQMIIFDEILDAVDFGYIDEDELVKFISSLGAQTEVIMTGHKISEKIIEMSDYVSEIKAVKHPYDKGVTSRKGIEY